jgi:alpha-L-rhamnosidase
MKTAYYLFILVLISGLTSCGKISPTKLTCEYMENPAVVDVQQPRLAWINIADEGERGQAQTAYQIKVASSKDKLSNPDLWDSQRVVSNESTRIEYAGQPLQSRTECWWQVRVWDRDGKASTWSEPAFWRMGILETNEWKAQWIGAPWEGEEHFKRPDFPGQKFDEFGPAAPMLRKSFKLKKR